MLAIKSTKSFRSSCKIVAKNVFLNFEVTKVFILKINKKSLLHSRSPYIQKNYCSAVVFWGVFNKDEVRYKKTATYSHFVWWPKVLKLLLFMFWISNAKIKLIPIMETLWVCYYGFSFSEISKTHETKNWRLHHFLISFYNKINANVLVT